MPKHFTVNRPDGTIATVDSVYDAEMLSRMNTDETITLLEGMRSFANYFDQLVDPIHKLENERHSLETSKWTSQSIPVAAVVTGVILLITILLQVTHHPLLGMLMIFVSLGAIVTFVILLCSSLRAKAKCDQRLPQIDAALKELEEKQNQDLYYTYLDQLLTGRAVLPDYYLNASALDFMISALRNHRASTLSQAVNLYEAEQKLNAQNSLLAAQLAAQESAARAAVQAASAAERAANSAQTAAINSIYNRK